MGGRFCSLDQMHLACESTLVKITLFCRRNWMNTKKKVFAENWSVFSPKLGEEIGLLRLTIQRSNLDGGDT